MLLGNTTRISALLDNFHDNEDIEIEAKFGSYAAGSFKSSVSYFHFARLLTKIKELGLDPAVQESTVSTSGNVRRITTTNASDIEDVIWQTKTKVKDFDYYEYDVRLSVNSEVEIDPVQNFIAEVTRERTRYSFKIEMMKLDMTEVMMATKDGVMKSSYEVELEFHGTKEDLPIFSNWIERIFKMLKGTHLLYTNKEKQQLIYDINRVFGIQGNMIKKDILVEARNIKKRDLVYGGIVGNRHLRDPSVIASTEARKGTRYVVTFKADGLRKMFIIHTTGIWLVYPTLEFNLVVRNTPTNPNLVKLLSGFSGTVFDGELVVSKKEAFSDHWFLAFDCLSFKGNAGIQNQNYLERKKVVDAIAKVIKMKAISIGTKETKILNDPQEFFVSVNEFLDKRHDLDFEEDGLMFIPVDTIYNPKSERYPIGERSVTKIPDTCKWKQRKDITIDFEIKWIAGNKLELYSYDSQKNKLVKFTGNASNPLTSEMIDHTNPVTLNKPSGMIVEYEWSEENLFIPRRIRYDKNGPNRLETALDNWEDIMSPVLEEDIRGDSLSMTFSYHNRIKRELFELVKKGNILDIGSGAGGDVLKWLKNVSNVVAVEPNSKNREELVRRLSTLPELDKRTVIIATGGEDTELITKTVKETIPGGKADVISLMLSMSFFWASDSHLEALVSTIVNNLKPGGKIIFLTIDGDSLEQFFGDSSEKMIGPTEIHLYPESEPPFGRAVDFILPGTIVGHQREYLVKLEQLSEKLEKYGIYLQELNKANKEKFLSEDNQTFTSLYSYGYYTNTNPDLLEKTQKQLINIILTKIPEPKKTEEMEIARTPVSSPKSRTIFEELVSIQEANYFISASPKHQSRPLPMLDVGTRKIKGKPFINDDTYAPLTCTWYNNLVRIATIGDGSCFIHAALKAFYEPYQNNDESYYRDEIAKEVRRDLAIVLGEENPKYPGRSYWETTASGALMEMSFGQMVRGNLYRGELDYSLYGLQRLFNSNSNLGDEVYKFISDIFEVDIYVLRADSEDLYHHLNTSSSSQRKAIVIVGNGIHYEVVAVDNGEYFQTVFPPGDLFISALLAKFGIVDEERKYDPETNFKEIVTALIQSDPKKNVVNILKSNFFDDDPIRKRLNKFF